ncbi:hypothetical protein IM793_23010 [Pedobacter sp. MR2016-19]|uniref:hypothetical protein n=1 Tax=Pedobacter sp. MR2016-19 TaxID=2780089 RepID=UPI001875EB84|nr:hypothetical protein [Pedobacter sp. MR2016-19]MBE5322044.1 hypothetical protein [Pedobacter sp. MR2016-19]
MPQDNAKSDLKKHLIAALEFFKSQGDEEMNTQKKWLSKLATIKNMSAATLSNHFTGAKEFYNANQYDKILRIIDAIILADYNHSWDLKKKCFTFVQENMPQERQEFLGLDGVWKGYSWEKDGYSGNASLDKKNNCYELKNCLVNIFILKIDCGNVLIKSGQSEYGGLVSPITAERFYMELTETENFRKTFMIGNGGPKKMSSIQRLVVAYADSGITNVKSGIAVLQRSQEEYENLVAKTVTASDLKDQKIVKILAGDDHHVGTQHLAMIME